jgi:putative aldouronate transport system permease protein
MARSWKKLAASDKVFHVLDYIFLAMFFLVIIFPLMHVISQSFSSPEAVMLGKVVLFPIEPTIEGYQRIFTANTLLLGFANSLYYTVTGTLLNVTITICAAYALSRRDLPLKAAITILFTFTMFFHGGMIPTYLVVRQLGLIDTRWAMILPNALQVWYVLIARTVLQQTINQSLYDAAEIDGAGDFKTFFMVVLPLSKSIVAVLVLWYAVLHWNSFFNALIYLNSPRLFNLQLVLRNILAVTENLLQQTESFIAAERAGMIVEQMKYVVIVVAFVPVMMLYPFVQRHFVKGVMIGSIKG